MPASAASQRSHFPKEYRHGSQRSHFPSEPLLNRVPAGGTSRFSKEYRHGSQRSPFPSEPLLNRVPAGGNRSFAPRPPHYEYSAVHYLAGHVSVAHASVSVWRQGAFVRVQKVYVVRLLRFGSTSGGATATAA